jgi:hypothetical protein
VATSHTKAGRVTKWAAHVKNDYTYEQFVFSTTQTSRIQATFSWTGTGSASVGIQKLAEVSLGTTTNFGGLGEYSVTNSYSRTVQFNRPGRWVIWAGHYTGSGSVAQRRCNTAGTGYSQIGSGSGNTYNRSTVTGLTDCALPAATLVEAHAKTLCPT